jgi:alcohol dehydrogenase
LKRLGEAYAMLNFWFNLKTKIYFGKDALSHLKEIKKKCRKILLVTGKTFVKKSGLLEKIETQLKELNIDYIEFCETEENPSTETVERGASICRKENCDGIIGIGGGSALDAAKAIAILATNKKKCKDFFGEFFGEKELENKPLYIIAIPTTSGTGSEITRYSIITNNEKNTKQSIATLEILPNLSLCNPELTYSLSPFLTAATGMDALSHAIEGYLTQKTDPISDALAKETIKIIISNLPKAVEDGKNYKAREQMMLGSLIAGMVINHTGTTAGHAMGYGLTIIGNRQHGEANALILPYLLASLKQKEEKKIKDIEMIFNNKDISAALLGLNKKIGLPQNLKEAYITEKQLREIIKNGLQFTDKWNTRMNISLTKEEYAEIYQKAYNGFN